MNFNSIIVSAGALGILLRSFTGLPVLDMQSSQGGIYWEYGNRYTELYPELYVPHSGGAEYEDDTNCVYLTFDDGPSEYTEELLKILDKHNIKATFFLSPEDTEEDSRLIKLIADKGHTIGIHTSSHVYYRIYSDVESYLDDFNTAFNLIYEATGKKCSFFRFPGGSVNAYNYQIREQLIDEMCRRGFVYFDWNVDSEDGIGASAARIYDNVISETAQVSRAIVLMHDGMENTPLVLEDIIEALEADEREFSFRAVTENVRPLQF